MLPHLSMVIHKDPNVVGIRHDTRRYVRSRPFSMDVDAGAAEGGVCEVAVVDGRLAARGDVEAIQTLPGKLWRRGIKLCTKRHTHRNKIV